MIENCKNCTWYENGVCNNPDGYFEAEWETGKRMRMEPEDGCTLWEEE